MIKTIIQGTLGVLTFGIYYAYNTNKMIEINNEKQNLHLKQFLDKMEKLHNSDRLELKARINK